MGAGNRTSSSSPRSASMMPRSGPVACSVPNSHRSDTWIVAARPPSAGRSADVPSRIFVIPLVLAVAANHLPAAPGASLHIAPGHVPLTLHNGAVVARTRVGAPVERLIAVADARVFLAVDDVSRLALRLVDC